MSIKLTLLKSGETLISDIKELVSENSETGKKEAVAYLLNKPHRIAVRTEVLLTEDVVDDSKREIQISLSPWIVLSADEDDERGSGRNLEPIDILSGTLTFTPIDNVTWNV